MTKRLREIIKNIKNWQFDLSDSLIQLFSTRPCTSQDLDINSYASSSLSVGGDLINWFDDYSWKTNRAHLTPHMSASFSLVESVFEFLSLQEMSSVRHLASSVSDSLSCTAYLFIAPGIYLPSYSVSFMYWLCLSNDSHLLSWRFSLCPIPAFHLAARIILKILSLNASNNENATHTH